jgi:hypothetical protein
VKNNFRKCLTACRYGATLYSKVNHNGTQMNFHDMPIDELPLPPNIPRPRTDAELVEFLAGAPEPVQMCAVEDDAPAALTRVQLIVIVILWCAFMYGTSWLAGFVP